MRNGFILVHDALHAVTRINGRLQQISQRLNGSNDALVRAANAELVSERQELHKLSDILTEVQAMFPEPSKGEIIRHYNPEARNLPLSSVDAHELKGMPKPLVLDPAAFLGVPSVQDGSVVMSKATFNRLEDRRVNEAILSMEEGPVGTVKSLLSLADEAHSEVYEKALDDKRPAGWTEALALEFVAESLDLDINDFANLFVHGDWPQIQKSWPQFQTWLNKDMEGRHG